MTLVPSLSVVAKVICVLDLIGGFCVAIVALSLLLKKCVAITTLIVIDTLYRLSIAFV